MPGCLPVEFREFEVRARGKASRQVKRGTFVFPEHVHYSIINTLCAVSLLYSPSDFEVRGLGESLGLFPSSTGNPGARHFCILV